MAGRKRVRLEFAGLSFESISCHVWQKRDTVVSVPDLARISKELEQATDRQLWVLSRSEWPASPAVALCLLGCNTDHVARESASKGQGVESMEIRDTTARGIGVLEMFELCCTVQRSCRLAGQVHMG